MTMPLRISTQRLIRSLGFRAEGFASAQEFLKSGCTQGTACLILDLRLPGMDGLQLQRLLASRSHRIPIIFVSASGSDQHEIEALEAGADALFFKTSTEQPLLNTTPPNNTSPIAPPTSRVNHT